MRTSQTTGVGSREVWFRTTAMRSSLPILQSWQSPSHAWPRIVSHLPRQEKGVSDFNQRSAKNRTLRMEEWRDIRRTTLSLFFNFPFTLPGEMRYQSGFLAN